MTQMHCEKQLIEMVVLLIAHWNVIILQLQRYKCFRKEEKNEDLWKCFSQSFSPLEKSKESNVLVNSNHLPKTQKGFLLYIGRPAWFDLQRLPWVHTPKESIQFHSSCTVQSLLAWRPVANRILFAKHKRGKKGKAKENKNTWHAHQSTHQTSHEHGLAPD